MRRQSVNDGVNGSVSGRMRGLADELHSKGGGEWVVVGGRVVDQKDRKEGK